MKMNFRLSLVGLGLLSLAGCGGGNDGGGGNRAAGEESSGSGASSALAEVRLDPGQWEMTQEVVSMEAPGMPKEMMAAMTGKETTFKTCITPEQAAKPNADFFTAKDNGCSYKDFSMAGGRIKGTMTCVSKEGPGKMTMEMDGQYSGKSYQMAAEMKTDTGAGTMTIKSKGSGRRLGDCPPGEAG